MNIIEKQQAMKPIPIRDVPVDKIGDKAVTHIAAALFFALVLTGAGAIIYLTAREYWQEILAALRGEVAARRTARPWTSRVRATARPRPVVVRVMPVQKRAAS